MIHVHLNPLVPFSQSPPVSFGFLDHTGYVTLYEPLSNVPYLPYLSQSYCQCGKIESAVENILSCSARPLNTNVWPRT